MPFKYNFVNKTLVAIAILTFQIRFSGNIFILFFLSHYKYTKFFSFCYYLYIKNIMVTKKITLNELRSIVKQIIKEDGIGMFHDPRMNNSFKDDDDKWENGALWVRIRMLKNIIGIKDDEIAEINAINLENKTWDEVKKIFSK